MHPYAFYFAHYAVYLKQHWRYTMPPSGCYTSQDGQMLFGADDGAEEVGDGHEGRSVGLGLLSVLRTSLSTVFALIWQELARAAASAE